MRRWRRMPPLWPVPREGSEWGCPFHNAGSGPAAARSSAAEYCRTRRWRARTRGRRSAARPPKDRAACGTRTRSGNCRSAARPATRLWCKRWSSAEAHELGFRVFQEIVEGRHICDRQSFQPVEEAHPQKIGLQEGPRRIQDQPGPGDLFLAGDQLLGGERGVAVHGAQMLGEGIASKMQQVGLQAPDAAVDLHRFMYVSALPNRFAPVVEADLAVRMPASVADPAAEILRQAWHGVGIELRPGLLEAPDLGFQRFAQRFIGVDGENPVIGSLRGREILLIRVARPRALDHAGAELLGDLHGAVVRPAVHDQNFIHAAQAFDGAGDVALLVQSDDRRRDLHGAFGLVRIGETVKESTNTTKAAKPSHDLARPTGEGSTMAGCRIPKKNRIPAHTSHL